MLSNEAVPTDYLQPDIARFQIAASGDTNFTTFGIAWRPSGTTVQEMVAEAKLRIGGLVDRNALDVGVGKSLVAKLEAVLAASDAGRNGACGPLMGLRNQIDAMSARDATEAGTLVELTQLPTALQSALGEC